MAVLWAAVPGVTVPRERLSGDHVEARTAVLPAPPLTFRQKVELALRILVSFAVVRVRLLRQPLPDVVRELKVPRRARQRYVGPCRLGRIVYEVLSFGPFSPRCLFLALVLYRLLRQQGEDAELVIGLPTEAEDKDAHAWVEVDGSDVGPPPGGGNYQPLVRYG